MANNATRFLLLTSPTGPRTPLPKLKNAGRPQIRTLLYLILHDSPGALLAALVPFDRNGMNLTFIQSRPLPGRAWDYGFFVEVDAAAATPAQAASAPEAKARWLGSGRLRARPALWAVKAIHHQRPSSAPPSASPRCRHWRRAAYR